MQAQRKFAEPARPRDGKAEDAAGWMPGTQGQVEDHSSPAHLMLRDLAARLHEPGPVAASTVARDDAKLPMPARLLVIGGLGIACWGAVLVAIITTL